MRSVIRYFDRRQLEASSAGTKIQIILDLIILLQ